MARGSSGFLTGQSPCTATASLVVPPRPGRITVVISPKSAVDYYVGPDASVSPTTGLFVRGGAPVTLDTAGAVYAVSDAPVTLTYVDYN